MELSGKNILVTGGCGLIGSTTIDRLVKHENVGKIVVLDNLTRGTIENLSWAKFHGDLNIAHKDIRNFDEIRPFFEGIDVVFHLAAIRINACASLPRECLEVMIDGTFNVATACVEASVKRVVAASSASIYGAASQFPTSEEHHPYGNRTWYGAAKMANEGLFRSFNDMYELPYVALRYFNVYGPRMDVFGKYTEVMIRWLDCLDKGIAPKIFGDGSTSMDMIYVGDIARANVLAAKSNCGDDVFNVGFGTEMTLRELLALLCELTENSAVVPEFLPERKINPVPRRLADTTKAEQVLGFKAEVSIREGLQALIDWRKSVLRQQKWHEYDPNNKAGDGR